MDPVKKFNSVSLTNSLFWTSRTMKVFGVLQLVWVVSSEALVPLSPQTTFVRKRLTVAGGAGVAEVPRAGPPGVYDAAVAMGATKASTPIKKLIPLSLLSGAHIALGAFLMVSCGGSIPSIKETAPGVQRMISGLMGLPMGLLMVLGGGGELVTGNFALVAAAKAAKKATSIEVLRNWSVVFLGNFVGSVLIAGLAAIANTGVSAGAIALTTGKLSASWAAVFCKGILCNILVCMAVYMSIPHKDLASKAAAVLFPISGFIALGLEHSVANMFLFPFAMFLGADFSVADFIGKNLIPTTLGNIVGGALCVGYAYDSAYGKR